VSDSFPFKWINKKWREGFYVTSMATAGSRWGVVMSRNAGFSDQVGNAVFGAFYGVRKMGRQVERACKVIVSIA
jgi:hypothetical protein